MIYNVSKYLGSDSYFKVQHISVSCLSQKLQIKTQKKFFEANQVEAKRNQLKLIKIDLFEKSKRADSSVKSKSQYGQ